MKKKEILIIFVLAILVTAVSSWFLEECFDVFGTGPFGSGGTGGCYYSPSRMVLELIVPNAWEFFGVAKFGTFLVKFGFLIGIFLWFVILFIGWRVIKKIRKATNLS